MYTATLARFAALMVQLEDQAPQSWEHLRSRKQLFLCIIRDLFSHGAGLHHRLGLAPLVRGYSLDVDLDRHGVISELFLLDNSYTWKRSWKQCVMPLCACEIHIPLVVIQLWNRQVCQQDFFSQQRVS